MTGLARLHAAIDAARDALDGSAGCDDAESALRDALAAVQASAGASSVDVARALHHLSRLAARRDDLDAAEVLAQRSLRIAIEVDAGGDDRAATLVHLASLHRAQRRVRAAEDDYKRALALVDAGAIFAAACDGYAGLLVELGREGEAAALCTTRP